MGTPTKKPELHVYAFCSAGGVSNAVGDYSAAATASATYFTVQGSAGEVVFLNRMIVHIEDGNGIDADKYGLLTALGKGIAVGVYGSDGTLKLDLTDGLTVKSNADWGIFCYDVSEHTFGAGNEFVQVRWTFARAGYPIALEDADYFAVRLMDNLTGLVDHHFKVQGWREPR